MIYVKEVPQNASSILLSLWQLLTNNIPFQLQFYNMRTIVRIKTVNKSIIASTELQW